MPQNPINGLKQAGPTDVDSLIQQRQAIQQKMTGLSQPAPAPQPPAQAPQAGPQSYGGFTFHQPTPDIEGLVKALKGEGMIGSNTQDIELHPDINELLRRAAAIPVGQ